LTSVHRPSTISLRSALQVVLVDTVPRLVPFSLGVYALLVALASVTMGGLILTAPSAVDAAAVHTQLRVGWIIAGSSWIFQLALAGSAAAVASGPGVRRALLAGARGLSRAVVPSAIALIAVAIGGVALVVPGAVLLALLAFTGAAAGAEPAQPPAAALRASVAFARAHWRDAVLVVASIIAADLVIALVAQLAIVRAGTPKLQLPEARAFTRLVVLALALASPIAATIVARVYTRESRSA
jgi:hypothetical protein